MPLAHVAEPKIRPEGPQSYMAKGKETGSSEEPGPQMHSIYHTNLARVMVHRGSELAMFIQRTADG